MRHACCSVGEALFCCNAVMYLSPRALQRVMSTFARSLVPDGYLFLSYAKSLHGILRDFVSSSSHGAFYYRPRSACIRATEAIRRTFFAPPKELLVNLTSAVAS